MNRYIDEWLTEIENTKSPIKKMRKLEFFIDYVDIVDDIHFWNSINHRITAICESIINPRPKATHSKVRECANRCVFSTLLGYCVFLTAINILFLDFIV